MHWFIHIIRYALLRWGYLALAVGLIAEDAGLPVPGETTLMFSSFLAHKSQKLELQWVILIGIAAAVLGDNLGFWVGARLGPRLIAWLGRNRHRREDIAIARDQIEQHGRATVFWARYIFGLRTFAGPVAGALGMEWREFLLCNALGAITWVSAIAGIGFAFGGAFNSLAGYFEKGSWAIAGGVFLVGYMVWRRKKRHYREHVAQRKKAA